MSATAGPALFPSDGLFFRLAPPLLCDLASMCSWPGADALGLRMLLAPQPAWPILPLQEQLAPWVPMLLGVALAIAFIIVVVDTVERL